MRLYSDTLTLSEIRAELPPGVGMEATTIGRPRGRAHGWTFRLYSLNSRRHRNTGRYGADSDDFRKAASYDQHGEWMARLFERDPEAIIGPYKGREHFHETTRGDYHPALPVGTERAKAPG